MLLQAAYGTARKRRYADSIESLVRNNIQKIKIDMANEVIDAGRFDMQTSMEERKQTLEALLQVREYPADAHIQSTMHAGISHLIVLKSCQLYH